MLRAAYVKKSLALVLASLMLAGSTVSVFAEEATAVEAAADSSSEEALSEQDQDAVPAEEAVEELAAVETPAAEVPAAEETPAPQMIDHEEPASDMAELPSENVEETEISGIIAEETDSDEIVDVEEVQFTPEAAFETEEQTQEPSDGKAGLCGDLAEWAVTGETGAMTLTISGTGELNAYDSAANAPWAAFAGDITTIVIEEGITVIKANDFAGLSALTEMTVADSVTAIPAEALTDSTANLVIRGSFGQAAEKFAADNSIPFVPKEIADLSDAKVTLSSTKFTYNGSVCKPSVKIVKSLTALKEGEDFEVSYSGNTNAGTAKAVITGKGNFKGTLTKTFAIEKAAIRKSNVAKIRSYSFTGKAIKPVPTVKVSGRTLKKGKDFQVKYRKNKKIGKAVVIIIGKGNYKGKTKATFQIHRATIADMKIKGIKDAEYTGRAITQKIRVKNGKTLLKAGRDYAVSYKDNVDKGTASVIIKGKGNFKGKVTETFEISAASIKNAKLKGVKDMPYTGKPVELEKLKVKLGSKKLKKDRDYTVKYKNNVQLGTATVTVTGKGNYKDKVSKTFQIKIFPISTAEVTGLHDIEYTGKSIMQKIVVKMDKKELELGKDYSVAYLNNMAVGTASVIITGMGSYNGTLTKQFNILPKGTTLTGVTLNKSTKRLTITWNAMESYVDGYELEIATNSKFEPVAKRVVLTDPAKNSCVFLVSNPNIRYYVKIRTYKAVNGKTFYSNWRLRTN